MLRDCWLRILAVIEQRIRQRWIGERESFLFFNEEIKWREKREKSLVLKMHLNTFKFQLDSSAIKAFVMWKRRKISKVLSHALDHSWIGHDVALHLWPSSVMELQLYRSASALFLNSLCLVVPNEEETRVIPIWRRIQNHQLPIYWNFERD